MVDYIIVGQGIAGTVLGLQLLLKGKKIVVIDEGREDSSSKAAAGIFNPVTGKRKAKTWQAEELFDYLQRFYPELESYLNTKIYHPKPVYMLFESIVEQNTWAGRISDSQYKMFLDINTDTDLYKTYIKDSFGGIMAKTSGYVDVPLLLKASLKKFIDKGVFVNQRFDYEKLKIQESSVVYDSIESKRIIFCEGSQLTINPFFDWLPFNLVKGEILTIEVEYIPDVIFNKNIFILPVTPQKCIAGATYSWDDLNSNTTEEAKEELKMKIEQLLKIPYKIIDQRAGIRPATVDRRPYLGRHPEHKNLFVFGGLGTKGVSIVPFYSEHFIEFIENEKELNKDVNINRHYSLYYSNNN